MGKPFKLALKEGLQTGSAGSAVVGTVASGVTYLARHEEWVIQSGLFAAGAFGLPDLPAQSLESVIQEPVAPKTVD